MKNSFENPSPEEIGKIAEERAESNAELIKHGAKYNIDKKGNIKNLELNKEQIKAIDLSEKEMQQSHKKELRDEKKAFNLKNDKKVVLAALKKQDGYSLKDASEKLRNDKEVVLAAIKNHDYGGSGILEYASEKLRNDKEVVLAVIKEHIWSQTLELVSENLRNDKEVVLAAVKLNGMNLQYASEKLRNDKEVVLASIKEYPRYLKYASANLRNDKEVILAAIKAFHEGNKKHGRGLKHPSTDPFEYISLRLQNDSEIQKAFGF